MRHAGCVFSRQFFLSALQAQVGDYSELQTALSLMQIALDHLPEDERYRWRFAALADCVCTCESLDRFISSAKVEKLFFFPNE